MAFRGRTCDLRPPPIPLSISRSNSLKRPEASTPIQKVAQCFANQSYGAIFISCMCLVVLTSAPKQAHANSFISSHVRDADRGDQAQEPNVSKHENPFCSTPACRHCFAQSSEPSGRILGDYCFSLMSMLKKGGVNVNVNSAIDNREWSRFVVNSPLSVSASDATIGNTSDLGYPYVPPFQSLAFDRISLTTRCRAKGRKEEAFEIAYGIDTAALAMAVVAAKLVCEDESAAMTEFFLKANVMPAGVPILGCKGFSYNGYTPSNQSKSSNGNYTKDRSRAEIQLMETLEELDEKALAKRRVTPAPSEPKGKRAGNYHSAKGINRIKRSTLTSPLLPSSRSRETPFGVDTYPALRDCFVTNMFSNSPKVPDLYNDDVVGAVFPQGTPNLYATAMKALAVHANKPSLSLMMIQRMMPVLSAMMVSTPRRPDAFVPAGFGLVIETPNATLGLGLEDEGTKTNGDTPSSRRNLFMTAESGKSTADEEFPEDVAAPTFHPGPGVRTLTLTRTITISKEIPEPNTTDYTTTSDETTTTTTTKPTSTTTRPTSTTTTTAAPTTTTTKPTTTTTQTSSTTTTTTTTTTPQPTLPPVTTSPNRFQNSVLILSQGCLYQWARNLLGDIPSSAIPEPTRTFLHNILDTFPRLLEPFLCNIIPDIEGFPTAFPRRLFIAKVGPSDYTDPSRNVYNGYQTAPDLAFDSDTQFGILAAVGSKGLTISICGNPTQTSLAIDRLLATLDYLVVRDRSNNDPDSNVIGIATSDPNNGGEVDRSAPDSMTTSMAIIAIQQVLKDIYSDDAEDGDSRVSQFSRQPNTADREARKEVHRQFLESISPQIRRAKNYLRQLRETNFMTRSNCVIRSAAFWPPYLNSSYADMTAMAGNSYQCGGETPSLEGTAMWMMAVSGTNPFKLAPGLHPPPPRPDNEDASKRWFEENRVLFLSLCGAVGFVVLAAVVSLVIANSKRKKRLREEEEDRRALVNPQILAASARHVGSSNIRGNGNSGRAFENEHCGSRVYAANVSGSSSPKNGPSFDSGREKKNMGFF